MSGMIEIENLTERAIEYRLDHQAVCVKAGKCFCTQGRRGPVATSIHIPGGKGKRTGKLDPRVTLASQLQADASGPQPKIRIIGQAAVKAAEKKAKASDEPTGEYRREKGSGRKGSRE